MVTRHTYINWEMKTHILSLKFLFWSRLCMCQGCLLSFKEPCKTYTIESTGIETDFAFDGFPFSSHSSSPKVILGYQGYLQEKIKKQNLVPLWIWVWSSRLTKRKNVASSRPALTSFNATCTSSPRSRFPLWEPEITEWRHCGRRHSEAQVNSKNTKNSEKLDPVEPCSSALSKKWIVMNTSLWNSVKFSFYT